MSPKATFLIPGQLAVHANDTAGQSMTPQTDCAGNSQLRHMSARRRWTPGGHHVHRTALTIHTSCSTRTADTPLPLSHSRSLTLWHLTLASILVRVRSFEHFLHKLYSAEVLLSTGGTAMRKRALSVLRARQLIVEQLNV
jgi:hypothetical protein